MVDRPQGAAGPAIRDGSTSAAAKTLTDRATNIVTQRIPLSCLPATPKARLHAETTLQSAAGGDAVAGDMTGFTGWVPLRT